MSTTDLARDNDRYKIVGQSDFPVSIKDKKTWISYPTCGFIIGSHNSLFQDNSELHWIQDEWWLESAIEHAMDDRYYPLFHHKVWFLMYHINKSHLFLNGNKRTSLSVFIYMMVINRLDLYPTSESFLAFLQSAAPRLSIILTLISDSRLKQSEVINMMRVLINRWILLPTHKNLIKKRLKWFADIEVIEKFNYLINQ